MNSPENQIQADVDTLKTRFTNTQELYREVATVLFFRYGITPTANMLYQHVRKGSMSAPAEALNRFWADLREKSRVRIQAPDLPEGLATQAGELVATLWDQAQALAQDSLADLRHKVEAELMTLRTERDNAVATSTAAAESNRQLQARVDALIQRLASTEQDLAAVAATKDALKTQLAASAGENERLQTALAEARQDFTQELEKTRALLQSTEDRAQADTKRHLLEIDRERSLAAKAQQELNAVKTTALKQQTQDREQAAQLQAQVAELREKISNLQGQLTQLNAQHAEAKRELDATRMALSEAHKIPKLIVNRPLAAKKRPAKPRLEKDR